MIDLFEFYGNPKALQKRSEFRAWPTPGGRRHQLAGDMGVKCVCTGGQRAIADKLRLVRNSETIRLYASGGVGENHAHLERQRAI